MAKAFIRASAATLIIIGRRADVLETAQSSLAEEAKTTGTGTKIITQTCDVTNLAEVDALWADLAAKNIIVDVYIANAAKFTEPQSMLSLGTAEVWNRQSAKSPNRQHVTQAPRPPPMK
jgi:NAD(P)-dependent dehydrogenase (short-subunit alcohol dehydrogenase family)